MVRLCAALPALPADDAIALAVRLGLWGIDAEPPVDAGAAGDLGQRCRTAGLRLVGVRWPPEGEAEAAGARTLGDALRLAAAAGALHVLAATGHKDAGSRPDGYGDDALAALVEACRAAVAAEPGSSVRVLVETDARGPVHSLLRAAEAVRRVASGRFGILFDPVGLMNRDTYFDNGSFLARCVQQLGPAIGAVRARDVLLRPDGFDYRLVDAPVGQGALEYAALLSALAGLPGEVPLLVEYGGGEAVLATALAHIRDVAARAGVAVGGADR